MNGASVASRLCTGTYHPPSSVAVTVPAHEVDLGPELRRDVRLDEGLERLDRRDGGDVEISRILEDRGRGRRGERGDLDGGRNPERARGA